MNELENKRALEALKWVSKGIAVIPIGRDKKPITRLLPGGEWKRYQTELPTLDNLAYWFIYSNPIPNMAIITGYRGLAVIDFDNFSLYNAWTGCYPTYAKTYTVSTNRGRHAYYFIKKPVKSYPLPGLGDLKSAGGYVVGATSVHESGHIYHAVNDYPILELDSLEEVLPSDFIQKPAVTVPRVTPTINHTINNPLDIDNLPPCIPVIDVIKSQFRIIDFFPGMVNLSVNSYVHKVSCIFKGNHKNGDRNPSAWINTKLNLYGCHVCTPKPMDVINLYARLNGISNQEAIKTMAQMLR